MINQSRRAFMSTSIAGAMSSSWLARLAAGAPAKPPKSCILLWMAGGPSQLETFDLKVGHKNGGPSKGIDTAVPGIRISEHLPELAKQAKDLCIIRSMSTSEGEHQRATEQMLTGYKIDNVTKYPALGSIVAKERGKPDNDLPNFISITPSLLDGMSSGFLGPAFAPVVVSGQNTAGGNGVQLTIDDIQTSIDRSVIDRRYKLLSQMQADFLGQHHFDSAQVHATNLQRAMRMVKTQARDVFKLDSEPAALRDAYGRSRFGQACLLARRMVERGVPFVQVTLAGVDNNQLGWDTHLNNFDMVKGLCEVLDPAWSTLINDLRQRGMLDSTLVVWMGEFGRTPTINPQNGRDHFPLAWSTVLAGGGIKTGQVVGKTSEDGRSVVDTPVSTATFANTVLAALELNPAHENITAEGRPIRFADKAGEVLKQIVG